MRIGIPKELKDKENRVAITPTGVSRLVKSQHTVWVEKNAGMGSGFTDQQYQLAGAEIVNASKTWAVDLVVKVKEPLESEYHYFNQQMIFTYFHLAGVTKSLTEALLKKHITAVAYETLEDEKGALPLLAPMSAVAGNMATLMGSYYLASFNQGRGVQLARILGKSSGKVVVIGDGTVGQHAIRVAAAMGAEVFVGGLDEARFQLYKQPWWQAVHFFMSNPENIFQQVTDADLIIGAVLSRGARAPKIITEGMVKAMQTGAVIVDVSIDQGGCCETSRPTTHSNPVFIKHGVVHYCVSNMPGAYPRTATMALTDASIAYVEMLANEGIDSFINKPNLARAINTFKGRITHKKLARDLGMAEAFGNIKELVSDPRKR